MAESPAVLADLVTRSLRPLTDVEQAWASTRLEDAYTQLVALRPTVDARLSSATVTDAFVRLVIQVQCAMVLRVLNNPDGVLEETGDDYTRRLDASVSTGALYATDAELQLLSTFDPTGDTAFSIRSKRDARSGIAPDPWWVTTTSTGTGYFV
jgi:hypothetical protein